MKINKLLIITSLITIALFLPACNVSTGVSASYQYHRITVYEKPSQKGITELTEGEEQYCYDMGGQIVLIEYNGDLFFDCVFNY